MHITALQNESLIMLNWQICGSVVWQDLLTLFSLSPILPQQSDNQINAGVPLSSVTCKRRNTLV